MAKYKVGAPVEWPWGKSHAEGKIAEIFEESVSRVIKGSKITRHGTPAKPAYLILQENGNKVLKLETELHPSDRKHGWA